MMKKRTIQPFLFLLFVIFLNIMARADIPSDATLYNKHYYKLFEQRGTWEAAKVYCESLGGHLVTITGEGEQKLIEGFLQDGNANCYWIGGYWNGSQYTWVTGEAFVYTNWGYHQPQSAINKPEEDEPYLSVYRVANPWESGGNDLGKWNDVSEKSGSYMYNHETTGLICEWDSIPASQAAQTPTAASDSASETASAPGYDSSYSNYTGEGIVPLTQDKTTVSKRIETSKSEEIKGASFPLLQARAVKVKKTSFTLRWNKLPGATKYLIYGNRCGKKNKYEYITQTKKNTYRFKKLKKGKFYKYTVVALKGNKVISVSKTVHVGLKGLPNPVKVKVNKKKVELIAGSNMSTFTLICSITGTKRKQHRGIAFETDNVNVARVTKNGQIKAVGKGCCNVYAYAQNGVYAKIKVTVTTLG